jgi:hypothetical protein
MTRLLVKSLTHCSFLIRFNAYAGSSNLVSSSLEVNAIAAATFAVDNILSTFDGVIERTERLVQMTSPGMQASKCDIDITLIIALISLSY